MASDPPPERADEAERKQTILAALQQLAQGNPSGAIPRVQPLADSGDSIASSILAYVHMQQGQYAQGLPYLDAALATGISRWTLATNYMGWASGDPSNRPRVPSLFREQVEAHSQADAISTAQNLVAQGNPDLAWSVLTETPTPSLVHVREQWDRLLGEIQGSKGQIDASVGVVEEARTNAIEAMGRDETSIHEEAGRIRDLVGDVTVSIQGAAAEKLADDYARRASSARRAATRWTIATLAIGVAAIALASVFVLVGLAREHDPSDILTKAGISIPLLALAAYLNSLGREERRDARTWRHVELQIRTSRPYLANLPELTRDEVQAALALRFFPGQSQDPHGGGPVTSADPAEVMMLIRELQGRTSGRTGGQATQGD